MLVAIDAVGIRMGGGASLLTELLRRLPEVRPDWNWLVFILRRNCRKFEDPAIKNGAIQTISAGDSALGRLWWLYRELPRRLHTVRADALLGFANVVPPRRSVAQVAYIHQPLAFRTERDRGPGVLPELRLRVLRSLILRGALRSDSVIVQTEDMRSRVEHAAPQLVGRTHVVPGCAVSTPPTDEIKPEKRHLIDASNWPRLTYVAHPAEHKNHTSLIRALPAIVASFPTSTLCLTLEADADGNSRDGIYIRSLRQLAQKLGVTDHIAWLGVLSRQEVGYLLRNSTMAIFPSIDESFGLPLVEAMAEGCPLAASDLPFARNVAGAAAVYFDPLNPESIARCAIGVIQNPERLTHLKHEAHKRKLRFEPHTVADRVAAILEAAVDQNSGIFRHID